MSHAYHVNNEIAHTRFGGSMWKFQRRNIGGFYLRILPFIYDSSAFIYEICILSTNSDFYLRFRRFYLRILLFIYEFALSTMYLYFMEILHSKLVKLK